MAVSTVIYNKARNGTPKGQILFDSGGDSFRVALMADTYTPDIDADEFWSDISAHEVAGTGYTADGELLANQAINREDAQDRSVWVGDDVTWPGSTITAKYVVIYKDTGNPATSVLIAYGDFGGNRVSTASTFLVDWDPSGLIEF